MQPPYQPSGNAPAAGGDPRYADPADADQLPPQTAADHRRPARREGHLLGLVRRRLAGRRSTPATPTPGPYFQSHHQPFNYFADFDPGTRARAPRTCATRTCDSEFLRRSTPAGCPRHVLQAAGQPEPAPGYAHVDARRRRTSPTSSPHLEKSPQWPHMLVVVTYDENGGFWDHVRAAEGRPLGPGRRASRRSSSRRFAKKGFVDQTPYDTDLDPALHHQPVRPRGPAGHQGPRRGDREERQPAPGRPDRRAGDDARLASQAPAAGATSRRATTPSSRASGVG